MILMASHVFLFRKASEKDNFRTGKHLCISLAKAIPSTIVFISQEQCRVEGPVLQGNHTVFCFSNNGYVIIFH